MIPPGTYEEGTTLAWPHHPTCKQKVYSLRTKHAWLCDMADPTQVVTEYERDNHKG